ncbi:chorismate synthase [Candidatus Contubernalis alkaliaceticus]|uniref:chorismate synthase n=1 Tax=Candidatus Contubernalis alkaliaceticus TaxID=338645 RepID=UPI00240A4BC2|nr:chorismate synthase [Candidatus Contubernalis alkalaceticus]
MMRYLSAGESHGPCLMAVIEGLPSNLSLEREKINDQLARRQKGYGRGGRMNIERDRVEVFSGLRFGKTLGSPLTLSITNRDYENWKSNMDPYNPPEITDDAEVILTRPRPGHADLAGALKYHHADLRNVLERASARETAIRVAVGSAARQMLTCFGIEVFSHVVGIGGVKGEPLDLSPGELHRRAEESPVRCADSQVEEQMIWEIDQAKKEGDSLGGVFQIMVTGAPPGLGSHVHWDRKLDARLAGALMSLQAIKGVEVGLGFEAASLRGSKVHDEIYYDNRNYRYFRKTNGAGGIEGGLTNGETILIQCAMKPIPTLYKPLTSVDMISKKSLEAGVERSDVCAVPAASVAGEAIAAWEIACVLREKFGGDSLEEMETAYLNYQKIISGR